MRESHSREQAVGIEWYVSDTDGIGGRLRGHPEDFRVREREQFQMSPLDAESGSYPYLVIRATLRGWDTNDFAQALSEAIGISRQRVSWAGTKDKHAVTTQLFALRDVHPKDLPDLRDAEITPIGRAGRSLSFGDLAGNEFVIRVRDSRLTTTPDTDEPDASRLASTTAELREFAGGGPGAETMTASDGSQATDSSTVGVPNFFGHQRFGSLRPITHEVGLHLLRDDPKGAVLAYTGSPFESEPPDSQRARERVEREADRETPDWTAALRVMPDRLQYERAMLHRLVEAPEGTFADDAAADNIWWDALAAVPENLGRLFVNAAQSYLFNRILSERLADDLPFHRPVEGDVCCFVETVETDRGRIRVPETDRLQRVTSDRVDIMTRHCQRERAFVTAPLVGTDTDLGGGEPGEIERGILSDVGVRPADFDLRDPYGSTGTRRSILVRSALTLESTESDPVFRFGLPSGAYATTLLREYMKTDPADL